MRADRVVAPSHERSVGERWPLVGRWSGAGSWSGARRQRAAQEEQTLAVLDAVAAGLEAGLSVPVALRVSLDAVVEPHTEPWSDLRRRALEGQALGPGWERAARRSGDPALGSLARAWAVAEATGAPLADAVRSAAHAAREARRLHRAVQVGTAGARATVTVLTLLPVAGVGLTLLIGVGPGDLYASRVGAVSALLGVVLLAAGHVVVHRMIAGVLGDLR